MNAHATALIADDEPLLRDALRRQLATKSGFAPPKGGYITPNGGYICLNRCR